MSDIGYVLLRKQKQKEKEKEGLKDETDSHKISKKEIIAVGTASLIPGSNLQTLTACRLDIVGYMSDDLNSCEGRIEFYSLEKGYRISGLRGVYDFIKEGNKYNLTMSGKDGKISTTCSRPKCRLRRVYSSGNTGKLTEAIHREAEGKVDGASAFCVCS